MALISCIECESQISEKATSCPTCGCPTLESMKNATFASSKTSNPVTSFVHKVGLAKFAVIASSIGAIFVAVVVIVLANGSSSTGKIPIVYAIGDTGPAGGKIFILPSTSGNTTGKYFEAAPTDVSDQWVWCEHYDNVLGASGTKIGTGAINTAIILATCTSGAAFSAHLYSTTNNSKTYSDWFLPSKEELNQLYINRTTIGNFTAAPYWSSSEYSDLPLSLNLSEADIAFNAWAKNFKFDEFSINPKPARSYVRPVRAFS